MTKLTVLALGEVKEAIRVARNAADVSHLKDDVFEYLNHLDAPDSTPKPDGMDINRLAMRVAKLIEHCESVEFYLKPAAEWVDGLQQVAKQQEGDK
jgi:hypothetical protein